MLKREITIGQVVQPADPAFTIADLSSVWIVANVPEEDAGHLQNGMEVEVHIPALPQEHIKGQLVFVSPIVDPAHTNGRGPHGYCESDRPAEAERTGQHEVYRSK